MARTNLTDYAFSGDVNAAQALNVGSGTALSEAYFRVQTTTDIPAYILTYSGTGSQVKGRFYAYYTSVPSGAVYLESVGTYPLAFYVNSVEHILISTSGTKLNTNVAVGTTHSAWAAAQKAIDIGTMGHIRADTATSEIGLNLYYDGANWKYKTTAAAAIFYMNAGSWYWSSAASGTGGDTATLTEKMRLTNVGYLGIGTSSPSGPLHVTSSSLLAAGSASVILSGDSNTERISIRSSTPVLHFGRFNSTYASPTVVASADPLGYIQFGGWDSAAWHRGAWIYGIADENYSTTRRGSSIVFGTALAGADSAISERMRIMHNGPVLINRTTNTANAEKLSVEGAIRCIVPGAGGWPHATNSEADTAIGLRIHNTGSWGFDFGNAGGIGWIQTRLIDNAAPSNGDIYLSPRGGQVTINAGAAAYSYSTTSKLMVYSASAADPTNSGTSDTAVSLRLHHSSVAFDFGVAADGTGWIQTRLASALGTNYDLALNANGGNVGIGYTSTTLPAYKLAVNGTTYLAGTLYPISGFTAYAASTIQGDFPVITSIGVAGALQCYNTGTADSDQFAGITFHNAGQYAVNFGLVAGELRLGGWSYGATSNRIVHEGLTNWALANATIPTVTVSHFVVPSSTVITGRGYLNLAANAYYNSGWKYILGSQEASLISMTNENIDFFDAVGGSADATATFHWNAGFSSNGLSMGCGTIDAGGDTGHITIRSDSTSKYGVHIMGYGGVTSNLFMGTTHGGTYASPTASVAGRQFAIMARTWDGSAYANTCAIQLEANATCASNDHPTNITFATTPDNSATRAEGMRLDFNGYLLIGYTTSNGAYKLQVNSQIYATNATIATSDARYKERVLPITDGLSVIKELNPVSFFWKSHPVHKFEKEECVGFLAQEVEAVFRGKNKSMVDSIIKKNRVRTNPHKPINPDDPNDADTAIPEFEEFYGMSDTSLIPFLVSAVKELSDELEKLKAK
jgi:hypothetical protein